MDANGGSEPSDGGHAPRTVPTSLEAEVLVVGAGSAGAAVALQLARRGRRVLLVDRPAAGRAAARRAVGERRASLVLR